MKEKVIAILTLIILFGGVLTWAILSHDPIGYGLLLALIILFGGYLYFKRNRAKLTTQVAGQIRRQTENRLTEATQQRRARPSTPQQEDPHVVADFSPEGLQGVGLRMNGPDGSVTFTDPMAIAQQAVGLQTAQELNRLLERLSEQKVSPELVGRTVDNVLRDMEQVRTERQVAPQTQRKRIAVDVNGRPGIVDPFGEYRGWRRK